MNNPDFKSFCETAKRKIAEIHKTHIKHRAVINQYGLVIGYIITMLTFIIALKSFNNTSKTNYYAIESAKLAISQSYYSIETAKVALVLAQNDTRPWITLSGSSLIAFENAIESKHYIRNIGKLPCYFQVAMSETFIDGKLYQMSNKEEPLPIMPNDAIAITGFHLPRQNDKIKNNEFKSEVMVKIKITYGVSPEKSGDYFAYSEYILDNAKTHLFLENKLESVNTFTTKSSSFK